MLQLKTLKSLSYINLTFRPLKKLKTRKIYKLLMTTCTIYKTKQKVFIL